METRDDPIGLSPSTYSIRVGTFLKKKEYSRDVHSVSLSLAPSNAVTTLFISRHTYTIRRWSFSPPVKHIPTYILVIFPSKTFGRLLKEESNALGV